MKTRTRAATLRALAATTAIGLAVGIGAAGTPASATQPSDDYDRDAVLEVTNDGNPATLDPHQEPTQGSTPYWTPLYDTLTDIAVSGEVRPRLAESWEFSEDGLNLVFTIRDGVSFHDGTALDAAAVVASLERARTMETSTQKALYSNVTGIEATGDLEVTLTLSSYDAALPWSLGTAAGAIVNPAAIEAGADLGTTSDGTGAYVVAAFEPNVKVEYVRADDEPWDPATGLLAGFIITLVNDYQVALNGLQGGQYDMIRINGQGAGIEQAVSAGFVQTQLPSMQTLAFWLNNQDPAFQDVRVRQAFQYAIDREGIANAVFDGGSECAATSQAVPFQGDGLFVEGYDPYPYDPEKAAALLEEAGAVGTEIVINDIGATNTSNLMQAAQPMLEAVGFEVELVNGTAAEVAPGFQAGDIQVAVIPNAKQAHPSIFLQRYFLSGGAYHLAEGEDQPILDELASIDTPAATDEEITAANGNIARILAEDIATLVVACDIVWSVVHEDNVANIDPKTLLLNMRVVGVLDD